MHKNRPATVAVCLMLMLTLLYQPASAQFEPGDKYWREREVTASAYTLAYDETKSSHYGIAAWGDKLEPGMRVIAISRDLIPVLGYGARVKIDGLPGVYHVRDKMHRRWRNKIDILVPTKKQAYAWGRRKVVIKWLPEENW